MLYRTDLAYCSLEKLRLIAPYHSDIMIIFRVVCKDFQTGLSDARFPMPKSIDRYGERNLGSPMP